MRAEDILNFWFVEHGAKQWWQKSSSFDAVIKRKFEPTYKATVVGELSEWRASARGRLAEIIVIDQFARNMYRDTPQAFAADPIALVLAQEAVSVGAPDHLNCDMQAFMLMPYMHSESLAVHEEAVRLFDRPGLEDNLDFEHKHKVIIEKYGRYPHRNAILGRASSPEEQAFLTQPGSSF
jgi:uncharacterized protein (DUF924 family)